MRTLHPAYEVIKSTALAWAGKDQAWAQADLIVNVLAKAGMLPTSVDTPAGRFVGDEADPTFGHFER